MALLSVKFALWREYGEFPKKLPCSLYITPVTASHSLGLHSGLQAEQVLMPHARRQNQSIPSLSSTFAFLV